MGVMPNFARKIIYDVTMTESGKYAVVAHFVELYASKPTDFLVLPYYFDRLSNAERAAEILNVNDVSLHHAKYILDDILSEPQKEIGFIR